PSPPSTTRLPSSAVEKLSTRKQPSAPPHPPTGTSTSPRRRRWTSPHATSQLPKRRSVSATAQPNASAAAAGSASPRGVLVGASTLQGTACGSAPDSDDL